jgi:DNA-binding NtrC family response regulator
MKENILIVEDEFIVAYDLQRTLENAGYKIIGIAASVKQALDILDVRKTDLVLLDIYLKGKLTGIDLAKQLAKRHIPFIYISANSNEKVLEAAKATQPYGFIVKPFRDTDVLLSIDIARYRYKHSIDLKSSGELYMKSVIEDIAGGHISQEQKLLRISSAFQPYIPFDFVAISGLSNDMNRPAEVNISRTHFDEYQVIELPDFLKLAGLTFQEYQNIYLTTPETTHDKVYTGDDFTDLKKRSKLNEIIAETFSLRSTLIKCIDLEDDRLVILSFYSRIEDIYKQDHLNLLVHLQDTLSANLTGIINQAEENNAPFKPYQKPAPISYRPNSELQFSGIVGNSAVLLKVLDQIKIVAPTDTSVLIMGDSGTGKEMIAFNLHNLSDRRLKPMITVNCAALPIELIESILFGHEKGSFTGATERRTGKFEEADGGTIFLDEVGEMPFELQSKLLRVLQEKEIERIGGLKPIPVNLRMIAATNRNLEKEISLGRFRLDLYYRLNVFPINIPALKDRKDDIPLLVNHFISKYSGKMRKNIKGVSKPILNGLMDYDWPGNIRELEHLIERSVLLCNTTIIEENYLYINLQNHKDGPKDTSPIKTIAENEREYILSVLQKCNGKISGEGGAAELLGIPATTLNSKIKKLNIKR